MSSKNLFIGLAVVGVVIVGAFVLIDEANEGPLEEAAESVEDSAEDIADDFDDAIDDRE